MFLLKLIIIALTLSLTIPHCTAMTVSTMFPNCSSIQTDFALGASGGDFLSIGCFFQSNMIEIDTAALWNNASATILVADGMVQSGKGIAITGPPAAKASLMMGKLDITVRGMSFGTGAIMIFTGALPPGSSLVMDGNSFYLTRFTSYSADVNAISIGSASEALLLTAGSYISVSNNIVGGNVTGYSTLTAVYLKSAEVYLSDASSLRMDGNVLQNVTTTASITVVQTNIRNITLSKKSIISMSNNRVQSSSFSYVYAVRWDINTIGSSRAIVFLLGGSSILMDQNAITNCVGGQAYAVHWKTYTVHNNSDIIVADRSSVSLSRNSISSSNFSAFVYAVFLYRSEGSSITINSTFVLTGGSSFALNDNAIQDLAMGVNHRYVVDWSWNSKCSIFLFDGSAITLNNNSATNVAGGYGLFTTDWGWPSAISLSLTNGSRITCNGNIIRNSMARTLKAGYWYWSQLPNITCTDNSFISFDGNAIYDTIISEEANAAGWDCSQGVIPLLLFSQNSNISMRYNIIRNVTSVGSDRVDLYVVRSDFYGACQLALESASHISISNNTAVGLNATFAYIALFHWNFARGSLLRIRSESRLLVEDNFAMGCARFVFIGIPMTIETNGAVLIRRNIAATVAPSFTAFFNFNAALNMVWGVFLVEGNFVRAQNALVGFVLVQLTSFVATSGSTVTACNNSLSWDASSTTTPAQYLTPSSFSSFAALCVPVTSTSTSTSVVSSTTRRPTTITTIPPTAGTTRLTTTTTRPTTSRAPTSTTANTAPATTSSAFSEAPAHCTLEARVVSQQGATLAAISASVAEHNGNVSHHSVTSTNGTITATAIFCVDADRLSFVTAANSGQVPSVAYAAAMSPSLTDNTDEKKINIGMVVGIIVGAVVVLAVVIGGAGYFLVVHRKRGRKSNLYENEMNGQLLVTQENLLKVEAAEDVQL